MDKERQTELLRMQYLYNAGIPSYYNLSADIIAYISKLYLPVMPSIWQDLVASKKWNILLVKFLWSSMCIQPAHTKRFEKEKQVVVLHSSYPKKYPWIILNLILNCRHCSNNKHSIVGECPLACVKWNWCAINRDPFATGIQVAKLLLI